MLDSIADAWAADHNGASIWEDSSVTFLDPCTKSGVFLREITRRLTDGLARQIPDLQTRVDHILTKQVFGIGITRLTSLMARRSLYCTKHANGAHSIAQSFSNDAGNIWYDRMEHTWEGSKCVYCGAPKTILDREGAIENYAYAFIHTDNIKSRLAEMFGANMQFDVIIGNPPYQMKGGAGGSSDSSIYHLFIEQAKKLQPRFLSMVVPSRWLAGGRGLDEFRREMLDSGNLRILCDYPSARDVFPSVDIMGGVCYFLLSPDHNGPCNVSVDRDGEKTQSIRMLDEFDVFVRDLEAVEILRKVIARGEKSVVSILTADTPFGIATNYEDYRAEPKEGDIELHLVKSGKRTTGYIARDAIHKNAALIDKWKVLAPKAHGATKIPLTVLGKPWLCQPPSAATQTFLAFIFDSKSEALSFETYYRTKFFRFLVSTRKITQDALRQTYSWVPIQKWDRQWTDEALYAMYSLTGEQIDHIESIIRPMNGDTNNDE
jgi:site-specific DNA-methyltransferase (adenine-specific)